jgi:hypothetical protein
MLPRASLTTLIVVSKGVGNYSLEFTYFKLPSYATGPKYTPLEDTVEIVHTDSSIIVADNSDGSLDDNHHTDSMSDEDDETPQEFGEFRVGGHLMSKFSQFDL